MATDGRKELIYVRRIKDGLLMVVIKMDEKWVTVAKVQINDTHGPPWLVSRATFWTLYERIKVKASEPG